jgi:hypothetical protein
MHAGPPGPRDPYDSVPADAVESNEPLEASFGEDLTEGYHCGLTWYVLHDEDRTIRLQAALLPSVSDPHETGHLEQADATLGVGDDAATLRVYLGTCLMTPLHGRPRSDAWLFRKSRRFSTTTRSREAHLRRTATARSQES